MTLLTAEQFDLIARCARDDDSQAALVALFEAQQAGLQPGEGTYQAVVDSQTEMVCRYRPDLTLTFVNPAYCQFVGFPADELIGHSFLKVIDERWHESFQQDIAAYTQNPQVAFNEHRGPRYDGAMRWLQWTRQPILDAAGNLVEIQAVGRDITDQRHVDEALSQGEERYRRLIEGSSDGILITSQTAIRYVNHALVDMLGGYDTSALLDKSVFDLVHPDYHDLMEMRITERGHDSEAVSQRQEQFVRLDGSSIDVEVTVTPIELDGTPASLIFVRDITRHKQSEAMLHDFQEQLKALHDLSTQLSKADSLDELCRQAVEDGRTRLGFDRLGLWFVSEDNLHAEGSYGTDKTGNIIDERDVVFTLDEKPLANLFIEGHTVSFRENVDLFDDSNTAIGTGWNAIAPLWSGDDIIGYLSVDNLLNGEPASPQQLELLMLYGSTLGHLATRKRAEETLHSYQESLKTLQRLSVDLSKVETFDEFCRQAVEEGRTRLGFDRLGLWLLSDDHTHTVGSYGTDAAGQTTDERDAKHPVDDEFPGSSFAEGESLAIQTDVDLTDDRGTVMGRGWSALAALWNGDEVIGYLAADNLLNQQPTSPQQQELLTLYGATLGHLATRIRAEEALHSYQESLKTLQRLSVDLSKVETFDEFCRQAVEKGRARLGFDRLGLWFLSDDHSHTVGSYGTDAAGQTTDERDAQHPIDDEFTGSSFAGGESLAIQTDIDLKDDRGTVLGRGWSALAALWNGDEVIGYLAADNLLNQQPTSPQQQELLTLYGATLGHLATRIRAEEALLQQQNAEQRFQEQLKRLNEVSIELSQCVSFDAMCKRAIELGRDQLGFDRLGLWFIKKDDPQYLYSTYGIDEEGNVRPEWDAQHFIPDLKDTPTAQILNDETPATVDLDMDLYDHRHDDPVGRGWLAVVGLRDGEQVIGCLYVDNLIRQQPLDNNQLELLKLYGTALGHLAQRKWIEDNLRRSEERYRAIFEGTSIGICLTNQDGYPVSPNPAYLQMLGYTQDELRQMTFAEFTHPDDRTSNVQQFQALMSGELQHYQLEKRYRRKDGAYLWVRLDVSRFPGVTQDERLSIALIHDISEQKHTIAELRRSEERFRTIFEESEIGITVVDAQGSAVSSNPAHQRMLGYTEAELRQMSIAEFTHPDEIDESLSIFRDLLDGKVKHHQFEKRYIRKDGKVVWARLNVSRYPVSASGEKLIIVLAEDISDIKQAENRLRESEARYRALLTAIPDLIFLQDRNGVFLDYHAPSSADLLMPPEAFLHKPLADVMPDKVLALVQPAFDQAVATGEMQIIEYPLPMGDQHHDFETRLIAYGDDRVISIIRDVTEQKQAHQRLAESETRFRQIADHVDDVFFIRDIKDNQLLYINPAYEKIWGRPTAELQDKPWAFIESVHVDDRARVENQVKTRQSDQSEMEYRIVRPDGDVRWMWVRNFPIKNERGEPYRLTGVIKDITERKHMEQQNLELGIQRERVNIIADFIRDASHEFRTPLSVINSKVYLAGHVNDAATRQEQLAGIQEQSDVILQLVESLVTMSRLDSDVDTRRMPVSISDMLRVSHINYQTRAAEKALTLRLDVGHDPLWVLGDTDDLYQAFNNVIENAMRYTAENGMITIQSRRAGETQFVVEITDTGSGIEDADLLHIFDRFFRGDRAHSTPGFGLGLSVSRKIIEQHGGQIEVLSAVGVGSTFSISLPLHQPETDNDTKTPVQAT